MSELRIPGRSGSIVSSNAAYVTARSGSGLSASDLSFTPRCGQKLSGGTYTCYETFVEFDTSILAGVSIQSVVLRGTVGQTHDATPVDFTVEARVRDWGTTVDVGDFVAGASLGSDTLVATLDTSVIRNAFLEYDDFTDVALAENLNTSGFTRLILSSDRMRANTAPAADEYEEFFAAGGQASSGPPFELVVTVDEWSVITIDRSTPTAWVESASGAYNTARAGASLVVYDGALVYNRIGQALIAGTYYLHETMLAFDTSQFEGADIVAAFLELYPYDDESATDFNIEARVHDWGSTIDTGDWVAGASLSAKTLVATLNTSKWYTASAIYQRFTDVALAANINKTGITRLLLCSDRLTAGTTPGGNERVTAWARPSDAVPPRLIVVVRRPANDDFADAEPFAGPYSIPVAGSTAEAIEQAPIGGPGFVEDTRVSFPDGIGDAASAFTDDVLYVVGGYGSTDGASILMPDGITEIPHADSGGGGNLGAVISIDSATGVATKLADLPELDASTWVYESGVRSLGALCIGDAPGVIIDGVFYVAGGYTNYLGVDPDTPDTYGALSTSDPNHVNVGANISAPSQITLAIDLETGVATRVADKPCAAGYAAAVAHEGKAYFIGGYTWNNNYPYIDIYDPVLDSWDRSSLGVPTAEGAAILHNGKIYVLDGDNYTWTGSPPDVGSDPTAWEAAATTYFNGKAIIYDIALDEWSIGAANDQYAGYGTLFVFERNGELVVNGSDLPGPLVTLFAYNPTGNSWRVLDETLDRERIYQAGGIRSDGMVYEFGGLGDVGPETPSLERPHGPAGPSLWWQFEPEDGGTVTVIASAPGTVALGVWTGDDLLTLELVAAGEDALRFRGHFGVTYYIQAVTDGSGVLDITLQGPAPGGWPVVLGPFNALPI